MNNAKVNRYQLGISYLLIYIIILYREGYENKIEKYIYIILIIFNIIYCGINKFNYLILSLYYKI